MGLGLGASPVLDSPKIPFLSVSIFPVNHLLVCFSCFLAHFEGWGWNRWAKWERTAPDSSKETGQAQVHAWGKSLGTASLSAWSLKSLSFCYFLPFLLLLSCRPGSVSPSSIKTGSCFSRCFEFINSSLFFFCISTNLFFSPFPLFKGVPFPPFFSVMKRLLVISSWGALASLGVWLLLGWGRVPRNLCGRGDAQC